MTDPNTAQGNRGAAEGNASGLLWSLGAFAFFILLLVVATFLWSNFNAQTGSAADDLTETFKALGPWAVLASILLMIVCALTPMPAEVPAMVNGMVFGPVGGTLVTWVGALIGALLAFALARWLGRPAVERLIAPRHRARFDAFTQGGYGAGALFVARSIPLVPFFVLNLAGGLSAMRLWTFTWVTAVGIIPLTILMVYFGVQLEALFF